MMIALPCEDYPSS